MREGTRRLLAEVPGIEVVGEASDYDSVLAETRRLEPAVVLMDIKMPPTHSMEGCRRLDPRILETLLDRRSKKPGSPLSELTTGELDALRLMAESRSNSAIASQLAIAVGTVEKRIEAIFSKLGVPEESDVNRRVAAVLIYLRESLPGS